MKYKDLVSISTKKFELLKHKSLVNHQYAKNIYESGAVIEREIRALFNEVLSSRYRATHGYIAVANSRTEEPILSPQTDLIFVDNFVPNTLYKFGNDDSMEIVAANSVVGVFEIKRTLSKESLFGSNGAIQQLSSIVEKAELKKNNKSRYIGSGVEIDLSMFNYDKAYYSNPIFGIIGLLCEENLIDPNSENHICKLFEKEKNKWCHIDIIASLGDFNLVPVNDQNQMTIKIYDCDDELKYGIKSKYETSKGYLISELIGYVLHYINMNVGRNSNLSYYYFNETLL